MLVGLVPLPVAHAGDSKDTPQCTEISGEVARGARFAEELPGGACFELLPVGDGGFVIRIDGSDEESAADADDWTAAVTPPYRGPNPLFLEGWQFRNADNTGPNELGEKNVNFCGEHRDLAFVTSGEDLARARRSLETLLWPGGATRGEIDAAAAAHESIPKGHGELEVVDVVLGNLVPGERATIERLTFWARLCPPTAR